MLIALSEPTVSPVIPMPLVAEETFDCPLVELNLIAELPNGDGYEFQRGEKETLPIEIVVATLLAFLGCKFL